MLRPALFANLTGWKHPQFIEDYRKLRQAFDREERKRLSYGLQALVREEAPWIFLWNQYDFFAGSARIEWKPRPDERIFIPAIRMKEAKPAK